MNEELEQTNYPLPNPGWDYYLTWCKLQRSKAFIDQGLKHLRSCEVSNNDSDETLYAFVRNAIEMLEETLA